jgi:hypothetical protein
MNWKTKIREIQIKLMELAQALDEGDYWMHYQEEDEMDIRLNDWVGQEDGLVENGDIDAPLVFRKVCPNCGEDPRVCDLECE